MNPPRTEIGGAGWPQWFAWVARNLRSSVRISRVVNMELAGNEWQTVSFPVTGAPSDAIVLASPEVGLPNGVVYTSWYSGGSVHLELGNAGPGAASIVDVKFNIEVR